MREVIVPKDLEYGELIVKSRSPLVIDDIRAQIYNNAICGCYAVSGGVRVEINGDPWPFNHKHTEIMAELIQTKEKSRK